MLKNINFDLQYSAAYGVLCLILELKEKKVIQLNLIGLLYRVIEKLIEYKIYLQSMPYFDRLNYVLIIVKENMFFLVIKYLLHFYLGWYDK